MRLYDSSGDFLNPYQKVVYVSANGSDSNSGESTAPLATISKALEIGATRINLAAGEYAETLSLSHVSDITIMCDDDYDQAVFTDARQSGSSTSAWSFTDCHNIKIVNVKVCFGDLGSFYFDGCDNIYLERCEGSNSYRGMGFKVQSSDVVFVFCKANDNYVDGFNHHVEGFTQYYDCYAENNGDDGFSNHEGTKAIYARCFARNNQNGITPVGGSETYVDSCVAIDNSVYGISYGGTAEAPVRISNCLAYGNGDQDYKINATGYVVAFNNRDKDGIAYKNFPVSQ